MDIVASEPTIRQPLNLHFVSEAVFGWCNTSKPVSCGLKVVKYDKYLRGSLTKSPVAFQSCSRADKITIWKTPTDDGRFESHKDFLTA